MSTFKAYLRKEILESSRQYRYIILAIGIIFFAISGPIMLKLLPSLMENQFQGNPELLALLFTTTRKVAMQGFIKDIFQIGTLVVVFTLCGILSDELTNQKFVFPYAKGGSPTAIVLSKVIHYSIIITAIIFVGFAANYYYSNLLFINEDVTFRNVLSSAAIVSLYYVFLIMLTIFFSSIVKKGIVAGIIVLGISYFTIILNDVKGIGEFLPYKLIDNARLFDGTVNTTSVIVVTLYCIVLGLLTVYRMSKVEVV